MVGFKMSPIALRNIACRLRGIREILLVKGFCSPKGGDMMIARKVFFIGLVVLLLAGCVAGPPVREGLKENLKVPAGTIEGNQFMGIRYPFKVSAPPQWKMTMEFPDFLQAFGYDKPSPYDKEQTELYIFNPSTQSSVQIDFTPADRYTVFSQGMIERLTGMGASSFKEELEQEFGKSIEAEVSPVERVSLKGVQFGAKRYATYTVKGVKREQGWIYAFSEPYQIFILYMLLEKEGSSDRQDLKSIVDSFEVMSKK